MNSTLAPPVQYTTSEGDLFRQILFNDSVEDRDDIFGLLFVQLLNDLQEGGFTEFDEYFPYLILDQQEDPLELINTEKIKKTTTLNKNTRQRWDNQQCGICLENIQTNEYVRTLGCQHFFHKKCIDPWIIKKQNNTCPLCRKSVV